ncbi:cytochrome C assembly family protein [Oceanobacillus massiliensis]|uniref:cytochrome C assembly family protein n=1 Tax=Oceanobacillus massiliensis TaxID=1465765 RepID=UPI0002883945|nr:cytochrome c biogenesis protein CcsA [Oceanobacillus massiliensis]
MIEMKWIYEIILIVYGFSLIGYFIDFIHNNRKANRIAFWLLTMVWLIQTIFFIYEVFVENNFPVATLVDSLLFYSWVLITFSLIINRLFPVRFIVFFMNVFGFFILLMYVSASATKRFPDEAIHFVHEILIMHITVAIISYGFFTIGFLFSIMYLVQYRLLKKKKGLKWLWRLGDLGALDSYSFKTISIGVPLLLIAIIMGVVWAYVSTTTFYWLDMKTIGSIVVLFVYIVYLVLRINGHEGKFLSTYNTAAFLILLINFFLFSSLSNFHF